MSKLTAVWNCKDSIHLDEKQKQRKANTRACHRHPCVSLLNWLFWDNNVCVKNQKVSFGFIRKHFFIQTFGRFQKFIQNCRHFQHNKRSADIFSSSFFLDVWFLWLLVSVFTGPCCFILLIIVHWRHFNPLTTLQTVALAKWWKTTKMKW